MRWLIPLALLVVGCGGSSPISPTPTPTPTPTFTGTVTDTVSGAPVLGFSATMTGSRVTITAPGYLTRDTRNAATVDLIPMAAPFDLEFYRQFARNALDTGSPDILRVLSAAPSFYLQTSGFDAGTIAKMESAVRAAVPAFTGDKFQVSTWESGTDTKALQAGTVFIEPVHEGENGICGRTELGAAAGHVRLNLDQPRCVWPTVLAHEVGHALGFGHVSRTDALMNLGATRLASVTQPSAIERYHGSIAYHRSAGNRDLDVDP